MLYIFNTANSVQIAWNAVPPAPMAASKSRFGGFSNFIRTFSAG